MSRQLFSNYPMIEYRGLNIRNLMLSVRIVKDVLQRFTSASPLTLEEGETATMVAHDYYGSVDYVWLVLMANNMTDPYSQWYKSQEQFQAYIIKKYGSLQQAYVAISHYQTPNGLIVTPVTHQYASLFDQSSLTAVMAYDHELTINESRRVINLIDADQAPRISLELDRALNNQ